MGMVPAAEKHSVRARSLVVTLLAVVAGHVGDARADEGGVSFWVPGQFGSLAAAPAQPGWAFATIGYYTDVSASGAVAASREITRGRFNPTVNVDLNATLRARVPSDFMTANYVFATPVLGGQFAFGMSGAIGRPTASIDGRLTASTGGLTTMRTGSISDTTF